MDGKVLKLGEVLIEEGLINAEQLKKALDIQHTDGRKLGQLLIELGFVTEEQLLTSLGRLYQLPYISLTGLTPDPKITQLIPLDILKMNQVAPVEIKDNCLLVAINNPLDLSAIQIIQDISGYKVRPILANRRQISEYLEHYEGNILTQRITQKKEKQDEDDAPIIRYVESLIGRAIKERASDIHLEPMEDKMRVRFRIDGCLYEKDSISKDFERRVISRIKIVSGMDVADNIRPQDGRLSVPSLNQKREYDIRVSTIPDIMGENMVLRILDKSFTDFSLGSLGMPVEQTAKVEKLVKRPYGMILVTGPTGAGKSTSLYAMLNTINNVSRNIITVEDPVEYKMAGINQTAINNRAGYHFATAIRHILRHDPDVIMVGEIRDTETADIAIRAALTGHLVMSTLHTNSAAAAITRLVDMGIEPFLIQSALIGVIAQRLVRRLCPHCKEEYEPDQEIRDQIKKFAGEEFHGTLARPKGCKECFQLGYRGRVAIYEILTINDTIRKLILKSADEGEIVQAATITGMKTLRSDGMKKALEKVTTIEEVLQATLTDDE
ncbi:MAG: Flp pilus assembly complex ATPase component TadA [Candidatus Omnitrophica bacterium]|nr:Flp pilus assembly complex ATPase component TadA [Candidatus Omnitrophota bacterium]